MPQSRKSQISLTDTPYYHCISRCVRRAFLCGFDALTGRSYEHRKDWVEQKLLFLSNVFSIDVCAYAVMSNHTHLVLHINQDRADSWGLKDILRQWHRAFSGTLLSQAYLNGEKLNALELEAVAKLAAVYKDRLLSISWFMRVLNESIARAANKEDECKGRFWEGRFKSQALLDEKALLACMAYVDLNPIRARAATSPETSEFTSIKLRLSKLTDNEQPNGLMPFNTGAPHRGALPFTLLDYLKLVDHTGKTILKSNTGHISCYLPNILKRLNISKQNWSVMTMHFTRLFQGAVGEEQVLSRFHANKKHKRRPNLRACRELLA